MHKRGRIALSKISGSCTLFEFIWVGDTNIAAGFPWEGYHKLQQYFEERCHAFEILPAQSNHMVNCWFCTWQWGVFWSDFSLLNWLIILVYISSAMAWELGIFFFLSPVWVKMSMDWSTSVWFSHWTCLITWANDWRQSDRVWWF